MSSATTWVEYAQLGGGVGVVLAFASYAGELVKRASRATNSLAEILATSTADVVLAESAPTQLATVRRWLQGERVGVEDGKVIVRGAPTSELRRLLEDDFETAARPGFGSALTGISLVITFFLIGLVLVNDVPDAIRSVTATNDLLSDAVLRMGAKFFVSATGVLATLLHRADYFRARRVATDDIDRGLATFSTHLVSVDEVRLLNQRAAIKRLDRIHDRLDNGVERLSTDIARLQSIEVSVKDLGTEVSASLGKIMHETLAEQMKTLLEDLKLSAERMQTDIQTFAEAALRQTADQIVAELRAVNQTLGNQAGSQIEQLLTKLQDVVSGGFSSESRNMSSQLAKFGEVIPRLGEQMDGVIGRMEGVLGQLAAHQAESTRSIEAIATASRAQAEQFGASIARSGQDAIGRVFTETATGVEELVVALKAVVLQSHASSDVVRQNMSQAGQAVAAALGETRQTAQAIQEQMQTLKAGMAGAAQNGQVVQRVAEELARAVADLRLAVKGMGDVGTRVGALVELQQAMQGVQIQLLQQMNGVWPQLLKSVADGVGESTTKLHQSWTTLAQQLEANSKNHGARLAEAVEELTDDVQKLHAILVPAGQKPGRQ